LLRKDLELHAVSFREDLEFLSTTMTVRLGSMLVVGFGVMIAAWRESGAAWEPFPCGRFGLCPPHASSPS
jgi:hypothetical protein